MQRENIESVERDQGPVNKEIYKFFEVTNEEQPDGP